MMLAWAVPTASHIAAAVKTRSPLLILASGEVLEDLDPLVVGVGDVDPILAIDEHAGRQPELSGVEPPLAEAQQEAAVPVEDLDGVEQRFDDVDMALAVERDALGSGEVSRR